MENSSALLLVVVNLFDVSLKNLSSGQETEFYDALDELVRELEDQILTIDPDKLNERIVTFFQNAGPIWAAPFTILDWPRAEKTLSDYVKKNSRTAYECCNLFLDLYTALMMDNFNEQGYTSDTVAETIDWLAAISANAAPNPTPGNFSNFTNLVSLLSCESYADDRIGTNDPRTRVMSQARSRLVLVQESET